MLGDLLDLNELPHHEQLQRRSNAARQHDERRGETDEMMEARKKGPVPEDLVHERIGIRFGRQMDGQPERARMALRLPFHGPGAGRLLEYRTAAGDAVRSVPGQIAAEPLGLLIDRIAALVDSACAYR